MFICRSYTLAVAIGFGIQVGLYAHLRHLVSAASSKGALLRSLTLNIRAIGAQGTPTTVIIPAKGSKSRIDGYASFDEMKTMIERMLFSVQ